jgi:hypothetical protein
MINRDPLGEICNEILDTLTYIAKLSELSLHHLYIESKYWAFFKPYFALWKAYNAVHFFILRTWDNLYWKHLYEHLYLCGLAPAITDEYVESRHAKLRAIIAEAQYDDDPRVQDAIAKARAILDDNKS